MFDVRDAIIVVTVLVFAAVVFIYSTNAAKATAAHELQLASRDSVISLLQNQLLERADTIVGRFNGIMYNCFIVDDPDA